VTRIRAPVAQWIEHRFPNRKPQPIETPFQSSQVIIQQQLPVSPIGGHKPSKSTEKPWLLVSLTPAKKLKRVGQTRWLLIQLKQSRQDDVVRRASDGAHPKHLWSGGLRTALIQSICGQSNSERWLTDGIRTLAKAVGVRTGQLEMPPVVADVDQLFA
jgi:hypothetical protein